MLEKNANTPKQYLISKKLQCGKPLAETLKQLYADKIKIVDKIGEFIVLAEMTKSLYKCIKKTKRKELIIEHNNEYYASLNILKPFVLLRVILLKG